MTAKDIGQQLRIARQELGASLEEAAEATRVRRYYLEALEEGQFGELPSPVQVRGFIRAYAKYLNLDAEALFAQLESHAQQVSEAVTLPEEPGNAEQAASQAKAVFSNIGKQLQERRKSLELSLEEVEQHTHIPEHYAQRLEAGQLDQFPSPTQARGMLSNYADFLGMETELIMGQYAEALQQRREARHPSEPRRIALPAAPNLRLPEGLRAFISADLLLGSLLGLGLIIFVLFSISRINSARAAAEVEVTAPPLVEALDPGPTDPVQAAATPIPEQVNLLTEGSATPEGDAPATVIAPNPGSVNVQVLANQRAFLRIVADGVEVFNGRTLPGGNYAFSANGQIVLLTGNAAALRVIANGQDMGILGIYGEVVELQFNAQGVTTPTLTPTPTLDPNVTGTPTESPTPTETPTPTQADSTVDQPTPTP